MIKFISNAINYSGYDARLEFIGALLAILISIIFTLITIGVTSWFSHQQIKASHENTCYQIQKGFRNERKSNEYSEKLKDIKYCVVQLSNARIESSDMKQEANQVIDALHKSQDPTQRSSLNSKLNVEKIQNTLINDYNDMVNHANNIYAYCKLLDLRNYDLTRIGNMIDKMGKNNHDLRSDIWSIRYTTDKVTVTLTYDMFVKTLTNYKKIRELANKYKNGFTDFINLFIDIKKKL